MTDQPNPTTPPPAPDGAVAVPTGPAWAEPDLPAVEPAEDGAPAQIVERASASSGDGATAPRNSRVRWAIALGGLAVVLAATIAILALAGGRPTLSVAVGYMPDDTAQYSEYRLDLPGDQRQKLAAFLSKLPGFADQAAIQPKLYEVFDKIVALASSNSQSFTADIEPWFDGQIATGSQPFDAAALGGGATASPMAGIGSPLIVVTIKDPAKANAWVVKTTGTQEVSTSQYSGATLYTSHGVAAAVTDKVLIGGSEAAVKAAVDRNGKGKLADDPEFKAAFASVSRDYVAFTFIDYRNAVSSVVNMGPVATGIEKSTRDALLGLVPAWLGSTARFEDDALVGEGTFPSIDVGYGAKNRASSLAAHAPASTLFYGETHDVGAAIKAFLGKLRAIPELTAAFSQIDQSAGLIGGVDGVTGWWGDMAIAIGPDANGQIGGGLLITPTDPAAAKKTFDTLRSFVVLAGAQSGVALRDEKHGDTTVTVVDFSGAIGASSGLPPGVKAEIAYAVTNDIVVIAYGSAYVNAVLDAGPGPSLAEDARFKGLLGRVGAENLGLTFVDVQGIRALVEPLIKADIPADEWAKYEKEYLPYIQPLDAFISSARVDGGLNRLPMAFTVK